VAAIIVISSVFIFFAPYGDKCLYLKAISAASRMCWLVCFCQPVNALKEALLTLPAGFSTMSNLSLLFLR